MGRKKNDGRGRLGGREAGTPNKVTQGLRKVFAEVWDVYVESGDFKKDLDNLSPYDRISVMEKLAQYVAPKQKSVDVEVKGEASLTIEDKLRELCGRADAR